MADTKVSALTAATAALGADEIPVNESGTSKKVTVTQLGAFMFTAGSYTPGSFTLATGRYAVMVKQLVLTGATTATLSGTARLRIL